MSLNPFIHKTNLLQLHTIPQAPYMPCDSGNNKRPAGNGSRYIFPIISHSFSRFHRHDFYMTSLKSYPHIFIDGTGNATKPLMFAVVRYPLLYYKYVDINMTCVYNIGRSVD